MGVNGTWALCMCGDELLYIPADAPMQGRAGASNGKMLLQQHMPLQIPDSSVNNP